MDDKATVDLKQPAAPGSLAQEHQGEAAVAELMDLREQRVLDYLRTALHMDDPLMANIGSLNADLMMFAHHMQRIIKPALEKLPAEPGALANVVPAVESHARVARQVERLAVLVDRLKRQRESTKKAATELVAEAREVST
jgi:hypothetical protein